MDALKATIEDYLDYISLEKGLSAATVDNYRRDLCILADFLQSSGYKNWKEVDEEAMVLFIACQNQKKRKVATIGRRISVCRGFSLFLLREGRIKQDFCRELLSPKLKRLLPSVLTPAEINRLLAAPDESPLGLRDRAMLEFSYGCGLRVSELLSLSVHDIDPEEQLLRCWGKGSKERLVPIGTYALQALDQYLQSSRGILLRGKSTQELFLNRLGDPLGRSGYWRIISGYGERLGLKLHPHTLRHSAATHMLDNGADLRLVQEFLGHSRINTTQIYTNLSRSELKSHYLQHHPRYNMKRRFIIIVLDSAGAGAAPDAARYASGEANTLGHVAEQFPLSLPCLQELGLGNILPLANVPPASAPKAAWGKMQPLGAGMDTTSGHWEIAGTPLLQPLPTFPEGFPPEIMEPFCAATGRGVLGNCPASGVEIIQNMGAEQVRSGKLIVYTSADSVFQLAAHEDVVPPEQLYAYCRIARSLLQGEYAVGRVIARPFRDDGQGNYIRTENRRDFSLEPPPGNLLERCQAAHLPVTAIGKIHDIFAGQHMDRVLPGHNNGESMSSLQKALAEEKYGLIFANFVDFDMLYGHRNDGAGYARALEDFDAALPQVLDALGQDDILAICADHGNDPTTPSSDHSREYVPLLLFGAGIRPVPLGIRSSFADLGQTAAEYLGLQALPKGNSFLQEIK